MRWEIIQRNPAEGVPGAKEKGDEMHWLSGQEAALLVSEVLGTRHEALYYTALKLGLKQGELLDLRWSDVDFSSSSLAVERSVLTASSPPVWSKTKTSKARTIGLPERLVAWLNSHRHIRREEKMSRRDRWKEDNLIFPGDCGRPYVSTTVTRRFKRHLRSAGLDPAMTFDAIRASSLRCRNPLPRRWIPTRSEWVGVALASSTLL